MANNVLTHQMIAREAAPMLEEELPFLKGINRTREKAIGREVEGYSEGATVKIKIPPATQIFNGAIFAGGGTAPDQKETYCNLTVNTRKHVALMFTAAERALNLTEFKERFLRPAISTLASGVQADLLQQALAWTPSVVGTVGSAPSSSVTYSQARVELERMLAPRKPRMALWSSDAQSALIDSSKVLFNPSQLLADSYLEGSCGEFMGFEFFESQSTPYLTTGTQSLSGITVNGAGQTGSTLSIAGVTSGNTITAGTVFYIANVYSVHPMLGTVYGTKPRQFVVTATTTASASTMTIPIYPPIATSAPDIPFCSAIPAAGAGLTFATMSGSAFAANTTYRQNLLFQRDAYAAAFVPLPVLASCEGYTFDTDEMALRVMTFGNGLNDTEATRIDVLYGLAAPRGYHATRVTE